VSNAEKIHHVNPIFLVEKIIRERILDSIYWKRHCFNLNLLTFINKAADLELIGTYANTNNTKPTHFMCLILKLLQLSPSEEIIVYFINQKDFKYLTCLGLLYARLTMDSLKIYELLEPFYNDYRKLRYKNPHGSVELIHMDEFVDMLLDGGDDDENCKFGDLILPRLVNRLHLEEQDLIEPRSSQL
ncbi:hypothetical protein PACTADRAFT_29245, partial [Pachysolen tannophilus NRRL Y-2460]